MNTFKKNVNNRIRLLILFTAMASVSFFSAGAFAQLDETWTITVNGQSVQVNPDGSFKIPNISAADLFGPGGPGTLADFLSDDFLRAVAVRTFNGVTQYAFSEPFQITNGETFVVGPMTFTDFPPPFPDSLTIQVDQPTLTEIGQTTQLTVTGILADGGAIEATLRSQSTIYRTSNPDIATVGQDGLVTAQGRGIAFITAVNEGATAVSRITVSPGDPLTTIEGFVLFEDGTPVDGADVNIQPLDLSAVTGFDGSFQISDVPTELGVLSVDVTKSISNDLFIGSMDITTFAPGIVTDIGIIPLEQAFNILLFGDRVGERGLLEGKLTSLGHIVANQVILPTDISLFDVIWHVNSDTLLSSSEQLRLGDFVSSGKGLYLSGEKPGCCHSMNVTVQTLLNSILIEPGIILGVNSYQVPGPYPFNQNAMDGIITTEPNNISFWAPQIAGGIGGLGLLPDRNILVTGAVEGNVVPVGGVWDCNDLISGAGRVVQLMDVNWFLNGNSVFEVIENIQKFLSEAGSCGP